MDSAKQDQITYDWLCAVAKRSQVTIPEHVQSILKIAGELSNIAIRDFADKSSFSYKEDLSPVGQADQKIEQRLKAHLSLLYSCYYFEGEETDFDQPVIYAIGDRKWLVDPIDGTRNNEYGRESFAISVALQEYTSAGWQTFESILMMPVTGEIIWASHGNGTYYLNYNPLLNDEPSIQVIKIDQNQNERPFHRALLDLSTKPFSPEAEGALIQSLRQDGFTHRTLGSAALALANVGSKSDGAISLAHDYDVAAGVLIAKEAGAIISQSDFQTSKDCLFLIVAGTNKYLHDAVRGKCDLAVDIG
jgi:myo-inositol-1(or 4)-monophosphatase